MNGLDRQSRIVLEEFARAIDRRVFLRRAFTALFAVVTASARAPVAFAYLTAACTGRSEESCSPSSTVLRRVGGQLLPGKAGGHIFIYPTANNEERVFRVGVPEKVLLFLDNIGDSPPRLLSVKGRNLTDGQSRAFDFSLQFSNFGPHWGENVVFPTPGCWELSVDEPDNKGTIVIEVR